VQPTDAIRASLASLARHQRRNQRFPLQFFSPPASNVIWRRGGVAASADVSIKELLGCFVSRGPIRFCCDCQRFSRPLVHTRPLTHSATAPAQRLSSSQTRTLSREDYRFSSKISKFIGFNCAGDFYAPTYCALAEN
jgi:hypothetical protein